MGEGPRLSNGLGIRAFRADGTCITQVLAVKFGSNVQEGSGRKQNAPSSFWIALATLAFHTIHSTMRFA